MKKYVYGTQNTRTPDRFSYNLNDLDCKLCKYWRGTKKGCCRAVCCCDDERADAIAHGRIKRRKGWDRECWE